MTASSFVQREHAGNLRNLFAVLEAISQNPEGESLRPSDRLLARLTLLSLGDRYPSPLYQLFLRPAMSKPTAATSTAPLMMYCGWMLTSVNTPAIVSLDEEGRIKLRFMNIRNDELSVAIKARRRPTAKP